MLHAAVGTAAAAAVGTGEVQKRPEGWVLPHETLQPEIVVSSPGHLASPIVLGQTHRTDEGMAIGIKQCSLSLPGGSLTRAPERCTAAGN